MVKYFYQFLQKNSLIEVFIAFVVKAFDFDLLPKEQTRKGECILIMSRFFLDSKS